LEIFEEQGWGEVVLAKLSLIRVNTSYICPEMRYYLNEWRVYRGLSQEELAEKSEVNQGTISSIEVDPEAKRQPAKIRKLAAALQCSPEELLTTPQEAIRLRQESIKDPMPANMNEEEFVDHILAVRFRGELSDEAVARLTSELTRSLYHEYRKRGGSSTTPDREST
jgi:transcriptional regulator with XRE-family HTH domain